MQADGSKVRQLSHNAQTGWAYQPQIYWSPDSTQILAVANQLWGGHKTIFPRLELIQADGSGAKVLFQQEQAFVWQVSWISGRSQPLVVFGVEDIAHASCLTQIFSITDTLVQQQVLFAFCNRFFVSPDGTQLAMSDRDIKIYPLNDPTDTSRYTSIIADSAQGDLTWSPNGHYIMYLAEGGIDTFYRIVYTNGAGQLPFRLYGNTSSPSWSSDSQWLTYADQRVQTGSNIYAVNIFNDKQISQLTDSGQDYAPQWQPQP